MTDLRAMTKAEGQALIAFLGELTDEQWNAMTVCAPWTVRHLVAHLTALGNQTIPNFAKGMVRHGFSFNKVVAADLERFNRGSNADVLERFRASVASPTTPKSLDKVALGEFMCHGEDIRRAVGSRGDHPLEHVEALGDIYTKTGPPIRGKRRSAGLSLQATDADWRHGDGPVVTGTGMDLILAITGRGGALEGCHGDGLDELRSRCA